MSVPPSAGALEDAALAERFPWLRATERPAAARLEAQEGIRLTENPVRGGADALWNLDSSTTARVDVMGVPEAYKPGNWSEDFLDSIGRHARNHDFTAIDLTGASESRIYQIMEKVYSLPPVQQGGIIYVGW